MPVQKITKEALLEKAMMVFHQKGYFATSMDDLAKACGLKKGSFYHYFPGKEALMLEVLADAHRRYRQYVLAAADDPALQPRERLERMLRRQIRIVTQYYQGCFFGNIALETANHVTAFREPIQALFDEWTDALSRVLSHFMRAEEARALAEQSVLSYEGAVMFTKLHQDSRYLDRWRDYILEKIAPAEITTT